MLSCNYRRVMVSEDGIMAPLRSIDAKKWSGTKFEIEIEIRNLCNLCKFPKTEDAKGWEWESGRQRRREN